MNDLARVRRISLPFLHCSFVHMTIKPLHFELNLNYIQYNTHFNGPFSLRNAHEVEIVLHLICDTGRFHQTVIEIQTLQITKVIFRGERST